MTAAEFESALVGILSVLRDDTGAGIGNGQVIRHRTSLLEYSPVQVRRAVDTSSLK